jgi:hypothetical protein
LISSRTARWKYYDKNQNKIIQKKKNAKILIFFVHLPTYCISGMVKAHCRKEFLERSGVHPAAATGRTTQNLYFFSPVVACTVGELLDFTKSIPP